MVTAAVLVAGATTLVGTGGGTEFVARVNTTLATRLLAGITVFAGGMLLVSAGAGLVAATTIFGVAAGWLVVAPTLVPTITKSGTTIAAGLTVATTGVGGVTGGGTGNGGRLIAPGG